jgi:hypothetical protein
MSTRCQIEFRRGDVRRVVYRHWDGYPSAVIPQLLEFLAWSTRGGDIEYESANFIYWSKRGLGRSEQLGFGICDGELHGDVEYYYVVEHTRAGSVIRAYAIAHDNGPQLGQLLQEVAVPQPLFSSSSLGAMGRKLPRVKIDGVWYFRDDRLGEFRCVDNPHERIGFGDHHSAA